MRALGGAIMSGRIRLSDDGTLDTVLVCRECGVEARYNYDPPDLADLSVDIARRRTAGEVFAQTNAEDDAYDAFGDWAIDDFDSDHECSEQDDDA